MVRRSLVKLGLVVLVPTLGCSSSSGSSPSGGAKAPPGPETTVFVEGALANAQTAESTHDQIFGGFRSQAASLGNVGHAAFVGLSSATSFLAVDTWNDPKGLSMFLSNPNVQSEDAQLFAGQPTVTLATLRDGWYGWGAFTRTTPDGSPAVVALIRGTLAVDPETAKGIHNMGAQQAQSSADAAGDIAHVVYLDTQDPSVFLVVDEWTNTAGPQAYYSSPLLAQGFSALLAGPPTITLYVDTSWVQW